MEYRLLYNAGNGYEDLDLGDEVPAMNYQIANLNELKSRQAAYSQAIKLPKTAKNMRILGFLDSFAVVADAAYTPRPCKLLCEGAQISPSGAVLYVDSIDENAAGSIECQVVSGTVDLFSLLGDVDNEQMGSSAWKSVWTSSQILKDNADRNGARLWPAVATLQGQSQLPWRTLEVYQLVPCYRFTTMIEELFRMYGYRVESDIFDDPYMKSLYITASQITADSDVAATFKGSGYTPDHLSTSAYYRSSVVLQSVSQLETLGGSKKVANENPAFPDWNQWQYFAAQPGDYKLEITIHNSGSQPLDGTRQVRVLAHATRGRDYYTPGTTQDIKDEMTNTSNSVAPGSDWNLEVEVPGLNTGDCIGFEILIRSGGLNDTLRTTFEVTAKVTLIHDEPVPGIGSQFDFAQATGFKTYKEMVQTFMQLFGVLVDVVPTSGTSADGAIGTVRMYTFQELYRRRDAGQYVDWSRKLVLNEERNVGFALANYAQNNIIQLTDNADDGTHNAGSFAVRNRTLTSEKTLFTIAAEAGRDWQTQIYDSDYNEYRTMAVVPTLDPMIETDEDGATVMTPTYKGCKAHLLEITEKTYRYLLTTGFFTYTPLTVFLPQALTVPMQALVDRYYKPLKLLMSNARTINAYFNLSALDIAQLDLLTPVWIKPYGCFFYISKINNFIAGQPTKVELVKMTSQEEQLKYYLFLNGRNQDVGTNAPAAATTIRIAYRTNGTLVLSHSGDAIADVTFGDGYIVVRTATNETEQPRVGTVSVSVQEDPAVVRKITITQERKVEQYDVTLSLRTDGENLYVSTSRPLTTTERVVILTRGAGRMAWINETGPRTRDYHPSLLRWHQPEQSYAVASSGKIDIPLGGTSSSYKNTFRWRLKTDKKGRKFVHITKANNSKGFGYKASEGFDAAVTFAVVVVKGSHGYKRPEISNRCYFESRGHIRSGALTQEFVVTKTP